MEETRPEFAPYEEPDEFDLVLEEPVVGRPPGAIALLLSDHALQIILVLAVIADVALFAYLLVIFDSLPDPLPLHFDVSGLPDAIDAKNGIFKLPIIGLIVLMANGAFGTIVHRHQRAASLLLAAGALVVQLLLWFAAMSIASR